MCIVSFIGEDFMERWRPKLPPYQPNTPWITPYPSPAPPRDDFVDPVRLVPVYPQVTKEEFDQLKKELQALKDVLEKAKVYDEITKQKDCEMEQKIEFLRRVAKEVGVDLESVFGKPKKSTRKKKNASNAA